MINIKDLDVEEGDTLYTCSGLPPFPVGEYVKRRDGFFYYRTVDPATKIDEDEWNGVWDEALVKHKEYTHTEREDKKMKREFKKYRHHGKCVWVNKEFKGKHREPCLCYSCKKFDPMDREDNCPIANVVYSNCVALDLVTPVWECAQFEAKNGC